MCVCVCVFVCELTGHGSRGGAGVSVAVAIDGDDAELVADAGPQALQSDGVRRAAGRKLLHKRVSQSLI